MSDLETMLRDLKPLLKRVDEDARGTRCLMMAEVSQMIRVMRALEPVVKALRELRNRWGRRSQRHVEEIDAILGQPEEKPNVPPQ